MTLDILALVGGLIFTVMGWRSGAISQSMRVIAAIAAFVAASPVSRIIQDIVFPNADLSGPVTDVLILVGSGVGIYIVLAVAGWLFARALWAASESLTLLDRTGGATLGLLKALILVYFLVAAVAMVKAPLKEVDEEDVLHLRDSRILQTVERHNVLVLWRFGDIGRLHDALAVRGALDDPKAAEIVRQNAEASDFLRSDKVRHLAEREDLLEAARDNHYHVTLADGDVRKYLNDQRFVGRLRMVEWETLRGRVEEVRAEG